MSRKQYPSDLTDAQWKRLAHLVPKPKPGGRPAKYTRREILNAILYQAREGCTWRALPHDLPPYRIAFHYFRAWQADGTWERVHAALREKVRLDAGRNRRPTTGVADSQSVRTTEQGGPRGFDGGKKARPANLAGRASIPRRIAGVNGWLPADIQADFATDQRGLPA